MADNERSEWLSCVLEVDTMEFPDIDPMDAIDDTVAHTLNRALPVRWSYYVGNQPKIFVTPKLEETFRALSDSLTENYCGLAINSRVQRLEITGWDGPGAVAADQAWMAGGFPLRQDTFYRWGLVHGTAYLVVADGEIHANPASVLYAHPDPDDWNGVLWAGKCWVDETEWNVTLWDERYVYRYTAIAGKRRQGMQTSPPGSKDFRLQSTEAHGFDKVPVVKVNPYGYLGAPLIDQISPIQDRINKITANKLIAAEFGAFRQRVFFTRQELSAEAIKQQPDTAIVLDPGDSDAQARVQEMSATDLANYDNAKNNEVDALFTIASLPRHLRVNPGATPSGDAIKADEGPFTEQIKDHSREFGQALIQAYELLNIDTEPIWRDPVVNDDKANAEIVATLVHAGIPWQVAAAKYLGMTPDEIAEATLIQGNQQIGAASQVAQQTAALLSNPILNVDEEDQQ